MLLHEVGHGEVAVCGVALRQENGVVEADLVLTGDLLQKKERTFDEVNLVYVAQSALL